LSVGGERRRWQASLGLAVVLALFALGEPAGAGAVGRSTWESSAFCAPKKPIRDFGLSALPEVDEIPDSISGRLPFAPRSVSVYGGGQFNHVLTSAQSVGYGFSERNFDGTVRLNWTLNAQMWALGRGGRPAREVDSESLYIDRLDAADQPHLELEPASKRGFYRFDIQFIDRSGAQLGAYGFYVKVVRPVWRVKLGLQRHRYRPGQLVLSRLENFGTEAMSYGEGFAVQRFDAGRWIASPELTPDGELLWLGVSPPGYVGICNAVSLPKDLEPGRYRVVKQVSRLGNSRHAHDYRVVAPFSVRPRA
jgi:hypothetical protein